MSSMDGLFETFAQIAHTDNARILAQANERDLLKALKELAEAADMNARDLPVHEHEAILWDARQRALKTIAKVERSRS